MLKSRPSWAKDLGLIRDKEDNPVCPDPWQIKMLDSALEEFV